MRQVVLLRLSALGDILLSEPVPRWLKEEDPSCQVVYVTRQRFAQVVRGWPAVDRVLALPDRISTEDLRTLRRDLKLLGPHSRVDLHNTLRSHRIWPRAHARLPKHRLQKWLLVHGKALPASWRKDSMPVWRRYLELAGCLNPSEHLHPRLVVQGEVLRHGAARHDVLVPGAGFATKAWPEARWLDFLPLLLERGGPPILILGGAGEQVLGRRLAAMDPARVRSLCGETSLEESARLVAQARSVVCGDTGLLHMADAAGVPGVALFGSTTRELGFYPLGQRLRVLERELPCRPCSHVGRVRCPLGHQDCLAGISARQVLEALELSLERVEGTSC